jgi:hypothetical protein
MALKEVNALVGIPLVRMTTDPTVFENGAFDLLCIHMSDMRLLNPHVRDDEMPLRFFICPTNSTAGISGQLFRFHVITFFGILLFPESLRVWWRARSAQAFKNGVGWSYAK